jgi:DNA-3-methyladenine glycosylase I
LLDPGIIRNRLKVTSTVSNAKHFLAVQKEFGSFDKYLYSFMPDNKPINNSIKSMSDVPARTEISDAIAKDMKKRGFKFFGTTICYAHMQATGMVNDHYGQCSFK